MITTLKEYIPHQQAWDLACAIDVTPEHWWEHKYKYKGQDAKTIRQGTVNTHRYIGQIERDLTESVQNGNFSYRFRRTGPHGKNCNCWECTFRNEVLLSEDFLNTIREHTSIKNPVLYEQFTSFYGPGDFLGTHTDEQRGCAFIIHLSWDWRPEYGGIFMVEDGSGNHLAYTPGWGDLVLMELGEKGVNHMVTEVSERAPRPRLAISGWFNEAEDA